ncbi:uncharacterized protein LOC108605409 [Drosophila busckii]|uniref:uncharacterized protein LOC108605409 n=1 Tax=Drosophila busckii TaxID=30019 RepID=UPI001433414B|nr:uncharacterized protein LOC108605409 [Drosophila busckii]
MNKLPVLFLVLFAVFHMLQFAAAQQTLAKDNDDDNDQKELDALQQDFQGIQKKIMGTLDQGVKSIPNWWDNGKELGNQIAKSMQYAMNQVKELFNKDDDDYEYTFVPLN